MDPNDVVYVALSQMTANVQDAAQTKHQSVVFGDSVLLVLLVSAWITFAILFCITATRAMQRNEARKRSLEDNMSE